MNSMCFRCGSKGHFAKACDKAEEGLPYACKQCGGELALTSRGATNYAISGGGGSTASSSGVGGGSSRRPGGASGVVVTPTVGSKRAAPTASSPPPAKVAKQTVATKCKVVSVCGQLYTSLSWYFLKGNPSPSHCKRAREMCSANALVLDGGHARIVKEFVGVGNRAPRPLCRIRRSGQWQVLERLGDAAVDTDVLGVRIKRAEQPLKNRLNKEKRGVLPYTD